MTSIDSCFPSARVTPCLGSWAFQSLSSFQVRCNLPLASEAISTSFNPCRVFKCAATAIALLAAESASQFQSLSGFQVRCNPAQDMVGLLLEIVSIPVGFSSALQRKALCPSLHRLLLVSIPVGFSSALQPLTRASPAHPTGLFQSLSGFQVRCNSASSIFSTGSQERFNPCRVFKCAATTSEMEERSENSEFQSLSGFQVRCN